MLLACLAIVAIHARSDRLLQDTDTRVLLARIAERRNPWSWFVSDWPLQNHFYRPVTALSFELDRRLFATASGFGLSASIYSALCVLALFWLCRELTDKPALSAGAALLFAQWHFPLPIAWGQTFFLIAFIVCLAGVLRNRKKVGLYLPAVLSLTFVATELTGIHLREAPEGFYQGVMAWLPSRTATLMTLFALIALASYLRFVRLGSARTESEPSPTDPPTTRNSTNAVNSSKLFRIWLPISIVATALALGSYEQAAMLPFILLLSGGLMRARGYDVKWGCHLAFWLLLLAVVLVRSRVLPPGLSQYQEQQMREGWNAFLSSSDYVAPAVALANNWWSTLSLGPAILITGFFYYFFWNLAGNVVSYREAFQKTRLAPYAWLCSIFAFLPMAFLKPFPHYHYFPMALRSIFICTLVAACWDQIIRAVSPPGLQAPARLVPAPGSLLHQ